MAARNYKANGGAAVPPKPEKELERDADGNVIYASRLKGHKQVPITQKELDGRKRNPPEMQYELMKAHYLENTDVRAFAASGEISETIASLLVYKPYHSDLYIAAPRFVSAAELAGAIDAYFEVMYAAAMNGSEVIPDVEHLALYLGTSRQSLMKMRTKTPEIGEVIENALNRIAAIKKQLAMHNKIPSLVYLSDIQNNHGYVNGSKVDVALDVRRETPTREALIEQAKYLP